MPGMKPTSLLLSALAIMLCALLLVHVTSALPLSEDLTDGASDQEIGRWLLRFFHEHDNAVDKRRPLSVNQDLVSLADMLQGDAGKKKMLNAQSFLNSIGKRSQDLSSLFSSPFSARVRRNRRISVGIALDTLSSMLRDQRRRKSTASVSSHFQNVGKRATGPH